MKERLNHELKVFLTAVMFYTRIPCPGGSAFDQGLLNSATRYFPFIGWIVGAFGASVFVMTDMIWSVPVSVMLAMISTILMTGAFHEDGWADVCDGFGGGWTKNQVLDIMKDSRIGTYGTVGIIMMLGLKVFLLSGLPLFMISVALVVGHTLSRCSVLCVMLTHVYVRDNDDAKAKPLAMGLSNRNFVIGVIIGLLPLCLLTPRLAVSIVVVVLIVQFFLARYFYRRIGGYTGDCLGAVQQISELAVYLTLKGVWPGQV